MSVIEFAEKRLQEEIKENDHGANNGHLLTYWSAYLQGARDQLEELTWFPSKRKEVNNAD